MNHLDVKQVGTLSHAEFGRFQAIMWHTHVYFRFRQDGQTFYIYTNPRRALTVRAVINYVRARSAIQRTLYRVGLRT